MVFELIAVIVAGFAGAGVALLLNRLLGGRLPRWLTPVAAGAAMLGVTIANEYGWYGRTLATLPEGFVVAHTVEDRAFYRPWVHVVAYVSRFLAVDAESLRTNPAQPGQRLADVYAFGRWAQPVRVTVAVDCRRGRRADVGEGTELAEDGALVGVSWREVPESDPVLRTVCDLRE